ncbi:MAG: C40 family peptidase [Chitinophagales bacterium]
MKDRFILLGILALTLASCSSSKYATRRNSNPDASGKNSSVQFVDNISINPSGHRDQGSTYTSYPSASGKPGKEPSQGSVEKYPALRFKYAILLNCSVEELTNDRLLSFIDEWQGVKYKYGGTAKDGIDCSAFANLLMSTVYHLDGLPRTSSDLYNQSTRIKKSELREGDLVFFHTYGKVKSVTHVGVYLRNSKFVHSSVTGVQVTDMQDDYFSINYVGSGRVLH